MKMSAHISNLRKFAFAVLTAAMAAACTEDLGLGTPENQPAGPVLSLTTGSSFGTRSDDHDNIKDEDEYAEAGEEVIRRVDLFFFDGKDDNKAPFHACEVTVDAKTKADLTVKVPQSLEEKFTNATYVYALVNLPATVKVDAAAKTIDGKSATLENLQQVWVTEEGFVKAGTPATFVMRGGNVENIEVSKGSDGALHVSGTILLERLASKIRLWADIPDKIYLDENGKTVENEEDAVEVWEKTSDNVNFYLYNLTKNGRIDGYLGSEGDTDPVDLGYDNVNRSKANAVRHLVTDASLKAADKDEKYTYSHVPAYYSYPNKWENGTLSKDNQTYAIVSVTWRKANEDNDGFEIQHCYYQLPVNALKAGNIDANQLAPNHYYRIKVHIGMLGSKDLGDPTPLDASYEVVDWVTNDVDVTIKDRRYLVVNQKEWVMNNVSTLEIPFHTSHKTKVEKCYVTYFRYNDNWGYEDDSRTPEYWGATKKDASNPPTHDNGEFDAWVTAAGTDLEEGEITASWLDNTKGGLGQNGENIMLYYKKKYFYDEVYASLNIPNGNGMTPGFKYYVGHEHPKTFQLNAIAYDNVPENNRGQWEAYREKYGIDSVYTYSIDPQKSVIRFNHPLIQWEEGRKSGNTDGPADYYVPKLKPQTTQLWDEFSRIEITIVIRHEDWDSFKEDGLFCETIHITQYPAIYVEESHNYGNLSTYQNNRGYGGGNEYVRINNLQTFTSTSNSWEIAGQGVFGVTNSMIQYNGTNMNPNMYVINITQLSDDNDKYEIGDPRSLKSNINLSDASFNANASGANNPNTPWSAWYLTSTGYYGTNKAPVSAKWYSDGISESNHTLKNYYPTDETSETSAGSKANFIPPTIRVASSFGKIQKLDKSAARRRCAAYQEAGRPAGRWRLPTEAEIEFIATMSSENKIPYLFGNPPGDQYQAALYWSSTDLMKVEWDDNYTSLKVTKATSTTEGTVAVRCVYDDWYWVKKDGTPDLTPKGDLETDFYWGDKPKDNTQAQSIIRRLTKSK